MDRHTAAALDAYITGNWGEDQFADDEEAEPMEATAEYTYRRDRSDRRDFIVFRDGQRIGRVRRLAPYRGTSYWKALGLHWMAENCAPDRDGATHLLYIAFLRGEIFDVD